MAQIALSSEKYKVPISSFLKKLNISSEFSSDLSKFKEDSLEVRPNIFFIQTNEDDAPDVLNLVSDIRDLFGAVATIIILGDEISQKQMAVFLAQGADQFFSFPLDFPLIEDFLSKRTNIAYYNAFKYRNIPSRSTEISIKFDVQLKAISSIGVILNSPHLIKIGSFLNFNLKEISGDLPFEIQVLTTDLIQLRSSRYEIYAVYFDISDEMKNAIIHEIRKS